MLRPRPRLEAGLTGGIASGKTTVAGFFADLGAFVVDADRLARQVMEPGGSAHDEVLERFGRGILDAQGRIDRRALAAIVFRDRAAREALNAIVHPRVREEARRRIAAHGGEAPVAIFDAALLVESGFYRELDVLIVVRCRRATQVRRIVERDGLGEDEANARIDAQAPLEDKLRVADHVIDTDTSLEETRRRTAEVWSVLLKSPTRS